MKTKHSYPLSHPGLLLLLLLFSFKGLTQSNWFQFKEKQNFSHQTPYTFVYKIPTDSVYSIVYKKRDLHHTSPWMQQPAYRVRRAGIDSLLRTGIPAGYYLLVNADNNTVSFQVRRKAAFYSRMLNMREDMLLEIRDTSGNLMKNAEVLVAGKPVYYNETMRGYITSHDHADAIVIHQYGDLEFYEGSKRRNRPYYNNSYDYDYNPPARTEYKGYLVTNKPKYLPGDTVKYKAYLLNPWLDKPVKEPLRVELMDQYNYGRPIAIDTVRFTEPGVYFSEFILGDSIKPDRQYTLTLKSDRYSISQRLKVEDYLLENTYLKVKGENVRFFQQGDSVHLYAHAYTSNSLPVLDGHITITVMPNFRQLKEKKTIFLPDTLYHKTVPVDPSGETYIGFATKDFPDVLMSLNCNISLVSSNFEKRDTTVYIQKSINNAYLSVHQEGTKLSAEVIRNKRSITATGYIHNGWGERIPINYPYSYEIREVDHYVNFFLQDDTGGIADQVNYNISNDSLQVYEDFRNDTAFMQVINPQRLWVKYRLYVGNKLAGTGIATGDTLLYVRSPKGKTVTMQAYYTWRNTPQTKTFKAEKLDKKMVIGVDKKDLIYPGQTDTIKLHLRNVDGKPIPNTNVTVLAFNSQFTEDNTPDFPYAGGLHEGLGEPRFDLSLRQKQFDQYRGQKDLSKEWAKRCGADTMFFYKNIFFALKHVAWYLFNIPDSIPQLAVYLKRGNDYLQPEMITIDGRIAYIRRATVTSDPHALFVPEGNHHVVLRFADEQFDINSVPACKGIKTNLFINIDSLKQLNKDSLRPFITRRKLADSFDVQEKQWLANTMLAYRTEYNTATSLIQGLQQYNFQRNPGYGYNYDNLITVGPLNLRDSILFFQYNNTKLRFFPERDFIYTMRPGMMRLERYAVVDKLNGRLSLATFWPMHDTIAKLPMHYDSLIVKPPVIKPDTQRRTLINYRVEQYAPSTGADHSARLSIINESRRNIKFLFVRAIDTPSRPLVLYNSYSTDLQLKPGNYELLILWTDSTAATTKQLHLRPNGRTIFPLIYDSVQFDFGRPPVWLAQYISHSYDTQQHVIYYQQSSPVYIPFDYPSDYGGSGAITGTVVDETKAPMIGAIVQILEGDLVKGGSATDEEGVYLVKPLRPGRYTVKVTNQSYKTSMVSNVIVAPDRNTLVNVAMELNAAMLDEVVIVQYKIPLIDPYGDGRQSKTSEEIERMATRTTEGIASTVGGVYSRSDGLTIGGARNDGSLIIIDGVQVRGRAGMNLAQNSIDQIDVDGNNAGRPRFLQSSKTQRFIKDFMANISGASGMRKEFRDWAIWEPNLWTDDDGDVSFSVRYPDNTTSWKTYVLAMNPKGFAGKTFRLTRAFKPLSAQLSAPRFLRYGDSVELIGKVMNYTAEPFSMNAGFTINDQKQGFDSFTVHNAKVQHTIMTAPQHNSLDTAEMNFAYSLTTSGGYSDGEIKNLPVYPLGTIENKGAFFSIFNDTVVVSKPVDSGYFTGTTRIHIDGNLLDVMLREIENIKEYPHGCTEQLTTKLLAISYEEAVKKLMGNKNFNNTKVKKQIVEKLVFAQHKNGSFGWFANNSTDYRITNYVVSTMQKVNNDGWLDFIIRRGLQYLDNNLETMATGDLIAALATLSAANYNSNYQKHLDSLDKNKSLGVHDQFKIVRIKKQQGFAYRKQLDSLVDKNTETVKGMYWGTRGYDWYRNDLATTLVAYELIKNDSIYGHLSNRVMQFLLSKRKNGYYTNTAETGQVLTTLLPDLLKQRPDTGGSRNAKIFISGTLNENIENYPAMFEIKNNKAPQFRIEKKGLSPAYVSVVYEYFNPTPVKHTGSFAVSTTFLKNRDTLVHLAQGEKVIMRATVECLKDAEYVMIELPIPAGCIQSAKKNEYYRYPEASRENYKDKTFIYCNALQKGTYMFDVELQARYKGSFNVNPAKAEMMYYPEEYGHNEIRRIQVK